MNDIYINLDVCGIVTPINKNTNSKSHIDYKEQLERARNNQQIMWDDAKNNPTFTIGGLFGFVHNNKYIEFHLITDIQNPSQRLQSWSENVGQTDRNVLLLSAKLYTMNWDTWLSLGCPKKVQGTSRIVGAHSQLSQYFKKFSKTSYNKETGELIIL